MRYVAFIAMLVLVPSTALANAANPFRAGDTTGDLTGDVFDLAVEQENIVIDLRQFPSTGVVRVDVTYHVRNPGALQPTSLQFVAAGMRDAEDGESVAEPTVELDGRKLQHRVDHDAEIRPSWKVDPDALTSSAPTSREMVTGRSIFFDVKIPSGDSQLHVAYTVSPWQNPGLPERLRLRGFLNRFNTYAVAYVLEPVRDWHLVGDIDVLIRTPDGWQVRTSPELPLDRKAALKRSGEALSSRALVVSFRPTHFYSAEMNWALALGVLVLLIVSVGGSLAVPLLRRKLDLGLPKNDIWWIWFAEGPVVGVLSVVGLFAGAVTMSLVAPSNHIETGWAYQYFFLLLLAAPVVLVVATLGHGLRRRGKRSNGRD